MRSRRNSRTTGTITGATLCLAAGLMALTGGCGENDEPLPPVNVTADGAASFGPPVAVRPDRMPNKSTLTMNLEETAQAPAPRDTTTAGPAESPVNLDTSTPQATAETLTEMMRTGQLAQLPQLFTPEYQEVANLTSQHLGPLLRAMEQARVAWTNQFPETPPFTASNQNMEMPLATPFSDSLSAGDVQTPSPDTASVALVKNDGEEVGRISLARVDGAWLVNDPEALDLPENPQERELMLGMTSKMTSATEAFANDLAAGNFANPDAAMEAFGSRIAPIMMEAMQKAMQGGQPGQPGEEPAIDLELDLGPPEGTQNAPDQGNTARPQPPRERNPNDPVDSTFSGPDMLRRR